MPSSRSATWIAFGAIVRRSLTTFSTPTRHQPRPHLPLSFNQSLVSKASKGKRIPRNHFTSHRPLLAATNPLGINTDEKTPKRKAAQRTKASNTSLRRVAVEAQRSRGTNLIRGSGKTRHVDPEAETKDVTAYCAAETYDIHIARDLLHAKGYNPDPCETGLFPQVLHVQLPTHSPDGQVTGDIFLFPSGSMVTWNVPEETAHHLLSHTLFPAAENPHLDRLEAEDLSYLEDPSRETSQIIGDTIILGTKALHPTSTSSSSSETDTILAKIALSSALARSTKLAVLESQLLAHSRTTNTIPTLLARGKFPPTSRAFILRKTGELLHLRAQLNLYSELTDSLPDILWDSPHEMGLEDLYGQVGKVLDVGQRIKALNERLDYARETVAVVGQRLSETHGHVLEWIIIWLIMIEVTFGTLHLWREREEKVDEGSTTNLLRRYLQRELEKQGKESV